jgi:hypothetical protein
MKRRVLAGWRPVAVASKLILSAGLGLVATASQAEVFISGFGSLIGGQVVSGDGYIANYTGLGIYGKNGSAEFGPRDQSWLNPESRFGVQATMNLSNETRVTAQAIARGVDNYQPKVEWLYLTHDLSTNSNVQVGKLRVPVYLYSDKMDVGFAYPWIRVPADAYSLDSVTFTGAKANYSLVNGEFSSRLSVWTGTDHDPKSKLMSYLFSTTIDRRHRFFGVVADNTWGNLQVRLSYTWDRMEQTAPDPAFVWRNENFDERFADLAVQYQWGNLTLVGEVNGDAPFYKSGYWSAIYQMGVNSFHVTQSEFRLDEPWEKHKTVAVGWRRDIGDNMAFKLDVTAMRDYGMNPFSGQPNPVIKIEPGHATLVSAGIDFVF